MESDQSFIEESADSGGKNSYGVIEELAGLVLGVTDLFAVEDVRSALDVPLCECNSLSEVILE